LDKLVLNKVGVYQIHWPNPDVPIDDTLLAFSKLYRDGLIDHIGVCNMSVDQIIMVQHYIAPIQLSTVQVRYSLLDRSAERYVIPFCQEHGILVVAYSPLGQNFKRMKTHTGYPTLHAVACRYGITDAQAALAWVMASGVLPIPRTNSMEHLKELMDVPNIELGLDDISELDDAFPIVE